MAVSKTMRVLDHTATQHSSGIICYCLCLAGLTEELLHLALDKRNDIRCSNWELCPLTAAQQAYAASDAYAALKLYQVWQYFQSAVWHYTTQATPQPSTGQIVYHL